MDKITEAVADLFWEYDRMSSSGQESLDKLATLIGIPTEDEFQMTMEKEKANEVF